MGSPDLSKIMSHQVGSEEALSFRPRLTGSSQEDHRQVTESLMEQTLKLYSSVNSDENCPSLVKQNLQKAFTYLTRSLD